MESIEGKRPTLPEAVNSLMSFFDAPLDPFNFGSRRFHEHFAPLRGISRPNSSNLGVLQLETSLFFQRLHKLFYCSEGFFPIEPPIEVIKLCHGILTSQVRADHQCPNTQPKPTTLARPPTAMIVPVIKLMVQLKLRWISLMFISTSAPFADNLPTHKGQSRR